MTLRTPDDRPRGNDAARIDGGADMLFERRGLSSGDTMRSLLGLIILVVVVIAILIFAGLIDLSPEGEALIDEAGDAASEALDATGEAIEGAGEAIQDGATD